MVATGITQAPAAGPAETAERAAGDGAVIWRPGEIWRDIARGGLAGLIVGVVVAGLGGRIAMRLAALLVPEASGALTENDNVIGAITLEGSLALIFFVGLFFGGTGATLWVTIRPWLPGTGLGRALLAAVAAIGLSSVALINAGNPDFVVLRNNAAVVAALVALVGLVGFSISLVDRWLDRRLPFATSARTAAASVYAAISLVGGLLFLPLVVQSFLGGPMRWAGVGLIVVGAATLAWWSMRLRGEKRPPRSLLLAARAALAITVLLGFTVAIPEIRGALGSF